MAGKQSAKMAAALRMVNAGLPKRQAAREAGVWFTSLHQALAKQKAALVPIGHSFRAAYWMPINRGDSQILLSEEKQSDFSYSELLKVGRDRAAVLGLDLGSGCILVGDWRE